MKLKNNHKFDLAADGSGASGKTTGAKIISRKYGEQSFKESDKNINLADELSDVLFVLLCLANQTEVDLQSAFDKRLLTKAKRDSQRHKSNKKLG